MNAPPYVTSEEARALLGVKSQTLYAYVSRGLIRSIRSDRGRKERLYLRADVEKMRSRADARAGHGPAAADALQYGEPVLTSSITELTDAGPRYRGALAAELARSETLESVAQLLWTGTRNGRPNDVRAFAIDAALHQLAAGTLASHGNVSMLKLFATYVLGYGMRAASAAPLDDARAIMRVLTGCFGYLSPRAAYRPMHRGESLAQAVLRACDVSAGADAVRALDAAFVMLADYELASATFVARVAASCGAELYACILAAMESSSGWVLEHERVARLLDGVTSAGQLRARVEPFRLRGEVPPGFNSRLLTGHAPRAAVLLDVARARPRGERAEAVAQFLARDAERYGLYAKAVLGLDAFVQAMEMPTEAVAGVFLFARTAGWVAHVLEQRASGGPLRPRAYFSQPEPGELL